MDVARAHRLALESSVQRKGVSVYNVGSGRGVSVLEMIDAFEQATDCTVPYRIEPRRNGDVAQCWASPIRARNEIAWAAERDVAQICVDALRWRRFWLDCLRPPIDAGKLPAFATSRSRDARARSGPRRPRPVAV
jgi:UDP-glucose 4-epimerase